jgi:hypothetical protein
MIRTEDEREVTRICAVHRDLAKQANLYSDLMFHKNKLLL